jgi:CTP synthase
MRLGRYACELAKGSLAERIYGTSLVHERHRHRFEFNCLYEPSLLENGLRISGRSPDGKFAEIAELPAHPWFLAVQFHPEFQSKPDRPHPLFASFVEAAYRHKTGRLVTADVTVAHSDARAEARDLHHRRSIADA